MLVREIKTALTTNQIVVVIGARETGKSACAEELSAEWRSLNINVLRIDASQARHPEDLNASLAELLRCDPAALTADRLGDDEIVRVIVDRCDCLFDHAWVAQWQEQWRALFTSTQAQGKLATVLFGRPLFRQIAGGDSSPLLNAGRVLAIKPLSHEDIAARFDCEPRLAEAIHKKTGGHPGTTTAFVDAVAAKRERLGDAVSAYLEDGQAYLVKLVHDHSIEARAILGELLRSRAAIHESALIQRHFETAHATGRDAVDDLCGSGLVTRDRTGDCSIAADLLRNVKGLKEAVSAPEMSVPPYEARVMDACWRCLFLSENKLRQFVAERLGAVDPAWWILHVPPEVRAAAEGRKRKEAVIAASEEDESHPLMYLLLSELFELVFTNWERVFGPAFAPLTQIAAEDLAQKLEAIRNRLAHSRPITKNQLQELEVLSGRLGLS